MSWGLLGPAVVADERRVRTLGLGATVRRFNELAVPGTGSVWFAKQLVLATLGIQIAELAREQGLNVSKIECANAIEALGCWLALHSPGAAARAANGPDPRVRGSSKLPGEHAMPFRVVRKRSFYVSQPMRMGTTAALQPLGLAVGGTRRFSALELTDAGRRVLRDAFDGISPGNVALTEHLLSWVRGGDARLTSPKLWQALSPLEALRPAAVRALRACMVGGTALEHTSDTERRRAALAWVEACREKPRQWTWSERPPEIDAAHWRDLQAGAAFFAARDQALAVLDAVEVQVAATPRECLPLNAPLAQPVQAALHRLRAQAQAFLDLDHDEAGANEFCRRCTNALDTAVLQELVRRDGRVLRLAQGEIRPGGAFRRGAPLVPPEETGDPAAGLQPTSADALGWPPNASGRVHSLYLFNRDLQGDLDAWLKEHGRRGVNG